MAPTRISDSARVCEQTVGEFERSWMRECQREGEKFVLSVGGAKPAGLRAPVTVG